MRIEERFSPLAPLPDIGGFDAEMRVASADFSPILDFCPGTLIYAIPAQLFIERVAAPRISAPQDLPGFRKSLAITLPEGDTHVQAASQLTATVMANVLHEMTGAEIAVVKTNRTGMEQEPGEAPERARQYDFYVRGMDMDGFNAKLEAAGGVWEWHRRSQERIEGNRIQFQLPQVDLNPLAIGAGFLEALRQAFTNMILQRH